MQRNMSGKTYIHKGKDILTRRNVTEVNPV